MKPTNTRQKQQMQGFVQHSRMDKNFQNAKSKEKIDVPETSEEAPKKSETPQTPIHHTSPKVGRNDLCICGSGKKYKKCCLGKSES